jgi:hypothetical protein
VLSENSFKPVEAKRLLQAQNDAQSQPHFNLALARVYINGADPKLGTRTWQEVMEHIVAKKADETRRRWEVAIKDRNFDCIRNVCVAEDGDWNQRTIAYSRMKLKSRGTGIKPALIRFGEDVAGILKRRPTTDPLFPYLRKVRAGDRATEFNQRCEGLGIKGCLAALVPACLGRARTLLRVSGAVCPGDAGAPVEDGASRLHEAGLVRSTFVGGLSIPVAQQSLQGEKGMEAVSATAVGGGCRRLQLLARPGGSWWPRLG